MTALAFEFATVGRIVFGRGKHREIGAIASSLGKRALLITGRTVARGEKVATMLEATGLEHRSWSVVHEPEISDIDAGVRFLRESECDFVVAVGGGSVIDAGKAIAALATNPGELLDYLEVVGKGRSLEKRPMALIAVPTTAGTGSEVTRNAVIASPDHRVKISLRHPMMLPDVALVDPELTWGLPRQLSAHTGMDALTQVIEPFVSLRANPVTDGFCREGIVRAARSIRRVCDEPRDAVARDDMSLASLFGGLALANAGLGAVHGFAGPIGGMFGAAHGAVCASLLPAVMVENIEALSASGRRHPVLRRYDEVARMLLGADGAGGLRGAEWLRQLGRDLNISALRDFGIEPADFPSIIEKARNASSMKGNPIELDPTSLQRILERSW